MVLSSAIVCDDDRRIADDRRSVFPYDRRRSQNILRSAIVCDHMETSLKRQRRYYRGNVCDITSLCLKGCCLFSIRIKGFVDCWSVQNLSCVVCWHCNSLYRGRFYVWASGLCSLYRGIRYIEVLFHTFYFSIYTLTDLDVLSNLIGSLSLANEHYSPPTEWIMRKPNKNKMAGVNSRFARSIKSIVNGFLLKMLLRSLLVYILKQLFFSISVNSGRIFTSPLRGSVNILPLFTSISKNNC